MCHVRLVCVVVPRVSVPVPPHLASPRRPHPVPAAALRDREAADRSSSPGHEAEAGGGAVPGRPRTKFSAAQLQELERSFREQRYIGLSEKRRLAAALNLSQSQVSAAGAPRARLCPPPERRDGPRAASAPAPSSELRETRGVRSPRLPW